MNEKTHGTDRRRRGEDKTPNASERHARACVRACETTSVANPDGDTSRRKRACVSVPIASHDYYGSDDNDDDDDGDDDGDDNNNGNDDDDDNNNTRRTSGNSVAGRRGRARGSGGGRVYRRGLCESHPPAFRAAHADGGGGRAGRKRARFYLFIFFTTFSGEDSRDRRPCLGGAS